MSTFIGKVGSTPICHMTSDTQTQTTLEGDPISTTLFHSQLPYVFAREQWEITSYTSWNSGNGRTFALPSDLQTFKSNNPDLGFLLILEDSSGARTLFDPSIHALMTYNSLFPVNTSVAITGAGYQAAFTDNDSQLQDLTRWGVSGNGASTFSYTLSAWDTSDTRITIFKNPMGNLRSRGSAWQELTPNAACLVAPTDHPYGDEQSNFDYCNYYGYTWVLGYPIDMKSSGLDIVKIRIVFLNIENTATTFDRQKDYSGTSSITIKDDEFNVGNIDLIQNAPILYHGKKSTSDTVTPVIGTCVGAITQYDPYAASNPVIGKVTSSGGITANNTPVFEFPDDKTSSTTMEYDFLNQVFKRDGKPVFSASANAKAMQVLGSKEFEFDLDGYSNTSTITESTLSHTATGSWSGNTANTVYFASLAYKGNNDTNYVKATSTTIYTVGDNYMHTWYKSTSSGSGTSSYAAAWFAEIASDGTVTIKMRDTFRNYSSTSSTTIAAGSLKLRLIAIGT
jgi:hypothetical protein